MHWKKDLTIETQFFEDGLEGIPDAILINPNQLPAHIKTGLSDDYETCAKTSAQIIQRILSNKLIQHFISCWETLKQTTLTPTVYRSHHHTSNSSLLSNIPMPDRENGIRLHRHNERYIVINDEVTSSNIQWLENQRSDGYRGIKMAQKHVERAALLKQIVDKLKKGKAESGKTEQKLISINQNQFLISQIKHLEQVTNQLQYDRMVDHMKYQKILQQQQNNHQIQQEKQVNAVDQVHRVPKGQTELQRQLWAQLILLKEQLAALKIDSQFITAHQFSRQAESNQFAKEKKVYVPPKQANKMSKEVAYQDNPPKREEKPVNNNKFNQNSTQKQTIAQVQPSRMDQTFMKNHQRWMGITNERLQTMQERQQMLKQQFDMELNMRAELALQSQKKQQTIMKQFLESQQRRETALREQMERQQYLRQALLKEELARQKFLRQHTEKEQQLKNQIIKQQQLKEEAIKNSNQLEVQRRNSNLQHYSIMEKQLKRQLSLQYQHKKEQIEKQAEELRQMQQELQCNKKMKAHIELQEKEKLELELHKNSPKKLKMEIKSRPSLQFQFQPQHKAPIISEQSIKAIEQTNQISNEPRFCIEPQLATTMYKTQSVQEYPQNVKIQAQEQHYFIKAESRQQDIPGYESPQKLFSFDPRNAERLHSNQLSNNSKFDSMAERSRESQAFSRNELPIVMKTSIQSEVNIDHQQFTPRDNYPPHQQLQLIQFVKSRHQFQTKETGNRFTFSKIQEEQLGGTYQINSTRTNIHFTPISETPMQFPSQTNTSSRSHLHQQLKSQSKLLSKRPKQLDIDSNLNSPQFIPIEKSIKLDEKTYSSFTSPEKSLTYPGSITDRTKVFEPIPEELEGNADHNMTQTSCYGYGYTTGMRHTTAKTTSAHIPHIIWNSHSDSRAEWQLTARPHQLPKQTPITSTKQYEWPKADDTAKDEPFCQCCPTFK